MKSISVYAFTVALASSALLIPSANAGGRHGSLGLSSSATSTSSTALSSGRSPLGEPVFLIPSSSSNGSSTASSGGPIGGYVPPRTPLPPLIAPPSTTATASLVPPSSTSNSSTGSGREHIQRVSPAREAAHIMSGRVDDRGTKVIFTPPPTIVGVTPSVTGTGNLAPNNLADRTFGPSILNAGLGSTVGSVGQGSQSSSQPPWVRITPLQYNGPTVQVPTTSSATSAAGN
jgi:hypothetical protein